MRPFLGSLVVNAFSSAGNFILTIAVATSTTAQQFGSLSIALTIYLLVAGTLRAAVLESLARSSTTGNLLQGLGTSAWLPMLVALPAAIISMIHGAELALWVFIGLPGLVAYDYLRTSLVMRADDRLALIMESTWLLATVVAAGAHRLGLLDVTSLVASWALTPSLITFVVLSLTHNLRMLGHGFGQTRYVSWPYATDSLMGAGSSQMAVLALGWVTGPFAVGAVRGAGTLLSPINIVSSAIRPVLLRQISTQSGWRTIHTVRVAVAATVLLLPLALLVNLIPDPLGQRLLGATWPSAQLVLLPITFEVMLALISGVFFAGVRAKGHPISVLRIRTSLGMTRVLAVSAGGIAYGFEGAIWSLPIVSLIGAIVWFRFYQILGKPERLK